MNKRDLDEIEKIIENKMRMWSTIYDIEKRISDLENTREKYKRFILRLAETIFFAGVLVYITQNIMTYFL